MTAIPNILETFPIEILFRILHVDFLLPHEQCGFSYASWKALQISNIVVGPLVNSSAILPSAAEQWRAAFLKLSPELQAAIEGARGILPCPTLVPEVNEQTRTLYERTWEALRFARLGEVCMARYYLTEATQAVQKADIMSPDVNKIITKVAWTALANRRTREAFENAEKGDEVMTKAYAMGANEAAELAGLPCVNEGDIMR